MQDIIFIAALCLSWLMLGVILAFILSRFDGEDEE